MQGKLAIAQLPSQSFFTQEDRLDISKAVDTLVGAGLKIDANTKES